MISKSLDQSAKRFPERNLIDVLIGIGSIEWIPSAKIVVQAIGLPGFATLSDLKTQLVPQDATLGTFDLDGIPAFNQDEESPADFCFSQYVSSQSARSDDRQCRQTVRP